MKKILCAVLVVALVICGATAIVKNNDAAKLDVQLVDVNTQLAEANAKIAELESAAETGATLQADLDAANAKIAELEAAAADEAAEATGAELQALVDLYKPFYDAQVVVEYDGGVVLKDDVMEAYNYYEQNFAQYGIDLVQYGLDGQYKELAAQTVLEDAVVQAKAAELGLDQIDEEAMAVLTEEAKANMENFIETVAPNFQAEGVSEEEVRAQAIEYLASLGYTEQELLNTMVQSQVVDNLYAHVTGDVEVTDEDVKATYEEMLAEQEATFTDDSNYNSARNNGEVILWNPEGYRAVKQVLIQFTEEQSAAISDLEETLDALNAELEAVNAPAEEPADETAEEAADETATTDEPAAEPRAAEEIQADIDAAQAELDAIHAELQAEAQEVVDKFNAGTAFADLIAEYNDDPGMNNEPTASNGYAVAANSTTWDSSFTEAAMSIEAVGGISEPTLGSYGLYIVYYESDIPAGPVAYETVSEALNEDALNAKIAQTYNDAVAAWTAELNPVYHYERLAG